jgi:hypothetical protein
MLFSVSIPPERGGFDEPYTNAHASVMQLSRHAEWGICDEHCSMSFAKRLGKVSGFAFGHWFIRSNSATFGWRSMLLI